MQRHDINTDQDCILEVHNIDEQKNVNGWEITDKQGKIVDEEEGWEATNKWRKLVKQKVEHKVEKQRVTKKWREPADAVQTYFANEWREIANEWMVKHEDEKYWIINENLSWIADEEQLVAEQPQKKVEQEQQKNPCMKSFEVQRDALPIPILIPISLPMSEPPPECLADLWSIPL